MTIDIALALVIGAFLGVFSSVILIGLAFAVKNKQLSKQEDKTEHE